MEMTNLKVFSYVRVSTGLQKEKKTYENQEKTIAEFIEKNNLILIDRFEDLGLSGADANRESFLKMISRLNEVDGIILYDLDRLARDFLISLDLIKSFIQKKLKIIEASKGNFIDCEKEMDVMQYIFASFFNAVEKKKINKRQKEGIERYKLNHGKWGREVHYGKFKNGKPMKKEDFIQEYEKLREIGYSKLKIAKEFKMTPITLYRRLRELNLFPELESF